MAAGNLETARLLPPDAADLVRLPSASARHEVASGGAITKRRIELTIETERLLIVRRRKGAVVLDCPICPEAIPLVPADDAARQNAISPRVIYRWIESGELHFVETAEDGLLVCALSLLDLIARDPNTGGPQ